jgi:hypothetical protein
VTLSAIEMHTTGLKIGTKNETALSANDAMTGTMITMALIMISPTRTILQPEHPMKGGTRLSHMT